MRGPSLLPIVLKVPIFILLYPSARLRKTLRHPNVVSRSGHESFKETLG